MRKRLLPAGAAMALVLGLLTARPGARPPTTVGRASRSPAVQASSTRRSPARPPSRSRSSGRRTTRRSTSGSVRWRSGDLPRRTCSSTPDEPGIDLETRRSPGPRSRCNSAKTYVVAVYRNGNLQVASESFFLHPRLAVITGATPNPFLPWIDDGYKDETRIRFTLAADVHDAEARVFKANSSGKMLRIVDPGRRPREPQRRTRTSGTGTGRARVASPGTDLPAATS